MPVNEVDDQQASTPRTGSASSGAAVPLGQDSDIVLFFGEPPTGTAPVASVVVENPGDAAEAATRLRDDVEVAARIERLGKRLHLNVDDFLNALEGVTEGPPPPPADGRTSQLSPHEEAALREAGLLLQDASETSASRSVAATAVRYARLVEGGLTVKAAAARLGVTEGRIRQQLAERTLYGVAAKPGWRLPEFQFVGDGVLSGLEQVLPALDGTLHPLAVEGFFTRLQPDLVIEEEAVSPRDWLASGGSPAVVAELASDLLLGA